MNCLVYEDILFSLIYMITFNCLIAVGLIFKHLRIFSSYLERLMGCFFFFMCLKSGNYCKCIGVQYFIVQCFKSRMTVGIGRL